MKKKYVLLMTMMAVIFCIANTTPVLASSTSSEKKETVVKISTPLELAEAFGGDASWVNGNEVTVQNKVTASVKTFEIIDSEIVIDLKGKYMRKTIKVNGGNVTFKNGMLEPYRSNSTKSYMEVVSGTLNIINCKIYGKIKVSGGCMLMTESIFDAGGMVIDDGNAILDNSYLDEYGTSTEIHGGSTTITDCSFSDVLIDGGTVLFKNAATVTCIDNLRCTGGDLQVDENTVVITTIGDYDSVNLLPKGNLGTVYAAVKDEVTYYDLPALDESQGGVKFSTEPDEGIMYIKALTKETVTDDSSFYYIFYYWNEPRRHDISIHGRYGYFALRMYRLEDGKIAVTKPHEKILDLAIYTPRNVRVIEKDYQTVEITWHSSCDGKGYQVYRSTEEDGKYTRIADITDPSVTQFLDTTVIPEFKYYYKVRNVIERGENADYSPLSGSYVAKTSLASPVVEATSIDYKTIQLSWTKAAGASGYVVYRMNSKGNDEWIGCVWGEDNVSYIDTGRKMNKEYSYRVRAFHDRDNLRINGAKSKYCTGVAVVGAPKITTSAESYNKIKVSWKTVPGADGYYVYRATTADGKYTLVKDIMNKETLSYIDAGRSCGKNYYYKVQSYYVVTNESQDGLSSSEKVEAGTSAYVSGKALPSAPTITVKKNSSTSAKITWKKVSGADGYQIYTYDRTKKKYVLLDTVGTDIRTYTAKGITKGVKHYFKVRAYKTVNEKKVNGAFSEIVKVAF